MKVYTRAGDDGTTGLFLGGRVSKADPLMTACGDLDEAVAVLGVARAVLSRIREHEEPDEPDEPGAHGAHGARNAGPRTRQEPAPGPDGSGEVPHASDRAIPATSPAELADAVLRRQRELFVVAADLAANPAHRDRLVPGVSLVTEEMAGDVEREIDELVARHPLRPVFVVPGTSLASATLDQARAVLRRAERSVVALAQSGHPVGPALLRYVNRLSDLVFVLARAAAGENEPSSHQ